MARFPLVAESDARDPVVAAVYEEIRQELGFGMVPNIFRSMAICPWILRAHWDKFRATILQGSLPRTTKEMVGVLISRANNSEYAYSVHLHGLSVLGVADQVLAQLAEDWQRCPLPEREKHILQFGLLAGTDPLSLTDADFGTLRAHDLTDAEIFEIIASADLFASVNVYTDSAGVEVDQLG
jgi:uncharacterized peroxidase-related enzyme